MSVGIIGQKFGMTRIFTPDGDAIPVTIVVVEPNQVVQIKTKANATHTHDVATQNTNGFLSKEDKVKLDGIAEGANKTIVDSSLSSTSVNPVGFTINDEESMLNP